jgi:hypothetical protein
LAGVVNGHPNKEYTVLVLVGIAMVAGYMVIAGVLMGDY